MSDRDQDHKFGEDIDSFVTFRWMAWRSMLPTAVQRNLKLNTPLRHASFITM